MKPKQPDGGYYRNYLLSRLAEVEEMERRAGEAERLLTEAGVDCDESIRRNRESLRRLRERIESELDLME